MSVFRRRFQFISLEQASYTLIGRLLFDRLSDRVKSVVSERGRENNLLTIHDEMRFKSSSKASGTAKLDRTTHANSCVGPDDKSKTFIKSNIYNQTACFHTTKREGKLCDFELTCS